MPARDGTGPMGQGARTGRGLGNCQPGVQPGISPVSRVGWNPLRWIGGIFQPGRGVGFGIRRGPGRGGRGRW